MTTPTLSHNADTRIGEAIASIEAAEKLLRFTEFGGPITLSANERIQVVAYLGIASAALHLFLGHGINTEPAP